MKKDLTKKTELPPAFSLLRGRTRGAEGEGEVEREIDRFQLKGSGFDPPSLPRN